MLQFIKPTMRLIVKRNVKGGEYDIETVHVSEVKKRYGRRS